VIDTIREGTAPAVIRRKGAAGELPVSLGEKIEILTHLAQDRDETIRELAYSRLQTWNPVELQQILSNPATPPAVLDFAATYLAHERKDIAESLLQNSQLAYDLRNLVTELITPAAAAATTTVSMAETATQPPATPRGDEAGTGVSSMPKAGESPANSEGAADETQVKKKKTLLEKLAAMSPSEKIKAALTGNMEERLVLIRDSNKLVARAVLGSPKLTDQEIENIASMKNVTEEVLRLIAMNRKFMRTYGVVRQLINNPRTPIDVGMSLLHRINDRDMKGLLLNKNIAEVVRSMAVKLIKQKEEANKVKLPGH
jgi:hypothetical protein